MPSDLLGRYSLHLIVSLCFWTYSVPDLCPMILSLHRVAEAPVHRLRGDAAVARDVLDRDALVLRLLDQRGQPRICLRDAAGERGEGAEGALLLAVRGECRSGHESIVTIYFDPLNNRVTMYKYRKIGSPGGCSTTRPRA